tara:strand:- start:32 stop:382 length:351 start_codon:yes stop_codon:yes gene_type:complete
MRGTFQAMILALAVLFFSRGLVDTRYMEISSEPMAPETDNFVIDGSGFKEYISVHSGVCFPLAATVFLAMTSVGASLPLAAAAASLLIVRTAGLAFLASRPDFLSPWFEHQANRLK